MTGEEQSNRFSRRSLKFAVCVIMLIDIASYNVLDEILLLVEFIFLRGKMCKFSTPVEVVVPVIRYVCSTSCKN